MKSAPFKLGLVVNPVAGMGGRVGLKGTDGKKVLQRAVQLGAKPVAPERALETLKGLETVKESIQIITYPNEMGEDEARACQFTPTIIGSIASGKTTAADTKRAVKDMIDMAVDLLLFVGGDGTARNVCEVVGEKVPVLGIPAGVKIHSAVFAVNPEAAATITINFLFFGLPLKEMEVMDVDEAVFREGRVSTRLYGYMLSPYEPSLIQGTKIESVMMENEIQNQAAIAVYIIEQMESDKVYIIGPGTTTRIVGDLLDEKKTLLGVDLFYNKKIIAKDVNETQILNSIQGKKTKIIVTPIGGQGFIFGRGNQQISPKVIREVGVENVIIISTRNKLRSLRNLRIDTGDLKLDEALRGYRKVITDYKEEHIVKVE